MASDIDSSIEELFEPIQTSVAVPCRLPDRKERIACLRAAKFNVAYLKREDVYLDVATDSFTSTLSPAQVSLFHSHTNTSSKSTTFEDLHYTISELTGKKYVLPTLRARAAENILFWQLLADRGKDRPAVVGNNFFDSTLLSLIHSGATPVATSISDHLDPVSPHDFKGDLDLDRVTAALADNEVRAFLVTLTDSVSGGQPVSLRNLRQLREIADRHKIPIIFDACRFAENAFLLRERSPELRDLSLPEVARTVFELADMIYISGGKDGLAPAGGVIALDDETLYNELGVKMAQLYGSKYCGGLPTFLLAVLAQGFREVLAEDYLRHRFHQIRLLASIVREGGVPLWEPTGGHAVFVPVRQLASTIPMSSFPGVAFLSVLYLLSGVRADAFHGTRLMRHYLAMLHSEKEKLERVSAIRIAIPRRRLSETNIRYIGRAILVARKAMEGLQGMRLNLTDYAAEYESMDPLFIEG